LIFFSAISSESSFTKLAGTLRHFFSLLKKLAFWWLSIFLGLPFFPGSPFPEISEVHFIIFTCMPSKVRPSLPPFVQTCPLSVENLPDTGAKPHAYTKRRISKHSILGFDN
jgi:hypothetical protein